MTWCQKIWLGAWPQKEAMKPFNFCLRVMANQTRGPGDRVEKWLCMCKFEIRCQCDGELFSQKMAFIFREKCFHFSIFVFKIFFDSVLTYRYINFLQVFIGFNHACFFQISSFTYCKCTSNEMCFIIIIPVYLLL